MLESQGRVSRQACHTVARMRKTPKVEQNLLFTRKILVTFQVLNPLNFGKFVKRKAIKSINIIIKKFCWTNWNCRNCDVGFFWSQASSLACWAAFMSRTCSRVWEITHVVTGSSLVCTIGSKLKPRQYGNKICWQGLWRKLILFLPGLAHLLALFVDHCAQPDAIGCLHHSTYSTTVYDCII